MIKYIHITEAKMLQMLANKHADCGSIHFSFSPQYLEQLQSALDEKNALQLFAQDKQTQYIAGYIAGCEKTHSPHFTILELFVDPVFQGQGIGSQLMQKIISFAMSKKYPSVIVQTEYENLPAQKLYEKCGFQYIKNPDWKQGVTLKLDL